MPRSAKTLARGNAARLRHEARAYLWTRERVSAGEAARFLEQLKAYRESPRVYRSREYLQALEQALDGPYKYLAVVSPETKLVFVIRGEKGPSGILDLAMPEVRGAKP